MIKIRRYKSFLEFADAFSKLGGEGPGYDLHGFERIVQDLISVFVECLQPEVHLGLGGVRNAVAHKLHIAMPRQDSSQDVSQGVVLVVEDIGAAPLIVLFLCLRRLIFWIISFCSSCFSCSTFDSSSIDSSEAICSSSSSDIFFYESDINYNYSL